MRFFMYGTGTLVCEDCYNADKRKVAAGELVGDEADLSGHFVIDSDTEAYQCDSCLVQNDAYDELPFEEY